MTENVQQTSQSNEDLVSNQLLSLRFDSQSSYVPDEELKDYANDFQQLHDNQQQKILSPMLNLANRQLSTNNYYLDSEISLNNRNQPYISQALHFSPLMKNQRQPQVQVREFHTSNSHNYEEEEESKQSDLFYLMADNTSGNQQFEGNQERQELQQSSYNTSSQMSPNPIDTSQSNNLYQVRAGTVLPFESIERQESADEESLNLLSYIPQQDDRNNILLSQPFNIQEDFVISNNDDEEDQNSSIIPDEQPNSFHIRLIPQAIAYDEERLDCDVPLSEDFSNDQFNIYDNKNPNEEAKIVKSNNDLSNLQTIYYVTPRGVVNSLRTYIEGDVTIGRQYINDNGVRPNDILLPVSDLAISRTHCRIIYKNGFKSIKRPVPATFLEFSKLFQQKQLQKSSVFLPIELRRIVLSYLKEPRQFYLQDLGSVHSTYYKVSKYFSQELRKGQNYQIGTDIYFNIVDIICSWNQQQQKSINNQQVNGFNNNPLGQQSLASYDDFMMYIAREYSFDTKIYGIEKQEFSKYLKQRKSRDHNQNNIDKTLTPQVFLPQHYSIVKLEIVTSGGISSSHLLVSKSNTQRMQFTLGRQATCDIVISQNTISREQCRFIFDCDQSIDIPAEPVKQILVNSAIEESKTQITSQQSTRKLNFNWSIRDGNEQRESANGTWLCLTDYRLRSFKQESEMLPIRQGSEFKISDTIFKIDYKERDKQ
eukprot:403358636